MAEVMQMSIGLLMAQRSEELGTLDGNEQFARVSQALFCYSDCYSCSIGTAVGNRILSLSATNGCSCATHLCKTVHNNLLQVCGFFW